MQLFGLCNSCLFLRRRLLSLSDDRVSQIKNYAWGCSQVILVGNKSDMENERVVSTERGKQLADNLGLAFYETSAKDNVNVRVNINRPDASTDLMIW